MGYLHIENLYRPDAQTILLFRECYAMEKIHGTSAHVSWNQGVLGFFSGGEGHERFVGLFDQARLTDAFLALGHEQVVVFGEAYGGKQQGMSGTYGKELRFVAFDVKVGESWLSVPDAEQVVVVLGLEFVWYTKCSTDLTELDRVRDLPSEQARRNGVEGDKIMEGVVLRPLVECRASYGERVIAKHKREEFKEVASTRKISAEKLVAQGDAKLVAAEWVTDMRLSHVLDKLPHVVGPEQTGDVIKAMIEDVEREGEGEIEWSSDVKKAIGSRTAQMYKQRVMRVKCVE